MSKIIRDKAGFFDDEEQVERGYEDVDLEREEKFEKLQQRVYNHLDYCKHSTARLEAEDRWDDVHRFWLGDQWSGIKSLDVMGRSTDSKKLHPCPVDNYTKSFIEGLVGDICDKPADIQVSPREDSDDSAATDMSDAVKYCWYRNNGDRKIEFAVRNGVKYGPLIAKVFWDNSWNGSAWNPFVGDVRFIIPPTTNIFIDPRIKATEEGVIQQGAFVIHCNRRTLEYVRRVYPERGWEVNADSYASYVTTLSGDDENALYDDDMEVLVVEYWYRGKPLADEFPADEDEEKTEEKEGWVHKAVVAGGVLLEHRTYVYPRYPFVMEWIYPSEESIYGHGDAEDMLMPQLVINKLNELSLEGADIQSQGNWLTEEGNIRNKAQFQKYARMGGSILPVVDATRTTRVQGGNVPSSLFVHYKQEQAAMEAVTGRTDVAQGRTGRRVEAAAAISLLLQQSGGRVRQRSRAVSSFVTQIVQMMVELIGENYTEERMVRVIGAEGSRSWKPVSRQNFLRQKVWTNPLTQEQSTEEYIPEFDIIVTAGSETPTTRAYYSQLAMELYQGQVIDDIALLDTLQFPGWREILARKQQLVQKQQEEQAMLQQEQMAQEQAQQEQPAIEQGGTGLPPQIEKFAQEMLAQGVPPKQAIQMLMEQSGGGQSNDQVAQIAQMLAQLQGGEG